MALWGNFAGMSVWTRICVVCRIIFLSRRIKFQRQNKYKWITRSYFVTYLFLSFASFFFSSPISVSAIFFIRWEKDTSQKRKDMRQKLVSLMNLRYTLSQMSSKTLLSTREKLCDEEKILQSRMKRQMAKKLCLPQPHLLPVVLISTKQGRSN